MFDRTLHETLAQDEHLLGATYARVSTVYQKDGISLDDQDNRMLTYAQQHGITVPAEYRFREMYSGLKVERPEYEKIRQLIRERRINVLIVYSSDRHTRDEVHGELFDAEMRRAKCQLHMVTRGQVDIYSASGRLLNTIERAFAKHWAHMIAQTTLEKKRAYLAAGIPVVQGFAPYGYERVGKKREAHLVILPEEAQVVRNMYTWFLEDVSVPEIGRRLHQKTGRRWAAGTIYRMLNDEVYAGVYRARRSETIDGVRYPIPKDKQIVIAVPVIISRQQWDACQKKLAIGRIEKAPKPKYQYLLSRRIQCACGHRSTAVTFKGGYGYYRCNTQHRPEWHTECKMPIFRVALWDAHVWEFTKALLRDQRALTTLLHKTKQELRERHAALYERLEMIDEEIAHNTQELERLVQSFAKTDGMLLDMLKREANRYVALIDGLKAEREKLAPKLQTAVLSDEDIAHFETYAERIRHRLEQAPFEEKREIIAALGFTFEMTLEEGERVLYVHWHVHQFRLNMTGECSGGLPSLRNGG